MSSEVIGVIGIVGMLLLMLLGVEIGITLLLVGLGGLFTLLGSGAALQTLGIAPVAELSVYAFLAVPLFILMGEFASGGRYSEDAFHAAREWLSNVRGGLAYATVAACALFAAASGSSTASAAAMGKVIMPEMLGAGYDRRLATGTVSIAGTLSLMIPPSISMVIYGTIAHVSISRLLMAGVLPGMLLALSFAGIIAVWTRFRPDAAPGTFTSSWGKRVRSTVGLLGLLFLVLVVLGGLFFGVWTPTEASAGGAFGALVLGLVQRRLSSQAVWKSMKQTGITVSLLFIMILGALFFSRFIILSGVASMLTKTLISAQLSSLTLFVGMTILYLALGCVMEGTSFMLITVPILLPVVDAFGLDRVWFGVYITLMIEIGLVTPPVAMNVFVVKSVVPELTLRDAYVGVMPFLVACLVVAGLLYAFPTIALVIPGLMFG